MDTHTTLEQPVPKIGKVYGYAFQRVKEYFLVLFLISMVLAVIQIPMGLMQEKSHIEESIIHHHRNEALQEYHEDGLADTQFRPSPLPIRYQTAPLEALLKLFGLAYFLMFVPLIRFPARWLNLRAMRGETFDIKELFSGFRNFLNIILANFLVAAIIGLGFIMLIVPGIIFACRLAFVPYLVMDRKLDPIKAVEASWELTRGYSWKIVGMGLMAVGVVILGFMALIVGVIFAVIWNRAAFATFYAAVEKQEMERFDQLAPQPVEA